MSPQAEDEAGAEVVAMQFAAGSSIAGLAEEWERTNDWVEAAVRRALLELIPRAAGGRKPSRTETRMERSEARKTARERQHELKW